MPQKTFLVVGGAGYIGSHMVLELLKKNINVVVLDDLSSGSLAAVKGGKFYHGDLADPVILQRIFSENDISLVMHFAAYVRVDESISDPAKYYKNNVAKTIVLLDEMLKAGIENFIFSSTAAVYGEPEYLPVDRRHRREPINPYGRTKYMVEQILKDYHTSYDLRYIVFRYFNAAGADPEGRIGYHEPATHLIPQVLKAASGRRKKFTIYGDNYQTPDGTCIRDYIHINDIVAAHMLGANELLTTGSSETFNLGTGSGYSVKEVVDVARKVTQRDFEVDKAPPRSGDAPILVANYQGALSALGWEPQFSDLETILRDAWLWEKIEDWDKKESTKIAD